MAEQIKTHRTAAGIRALQGAFIGLVLISIFLFLPKHADYGVRVFVPLATVFTGGAFGGIFYYLLDPMRYQGGWKKVLANVLSLLVYIFLLWFSSVPGLAAVGLWD